MCGRGLFRALALVPLLVATVALACAQAALADSINVTISPTAVAAGANFTVKAVAVDSTGHTLTSFSGPGAWSDASGGLVPSAPLNFVGGVSSTKAHVPTAYKGDTVTVTSGGLSGTSKPFAVFGPLDHIVLFSRAQALDCIRY